MSIINSLDISIPHHMLTKYGPRPYAYIEVLLYVGVLLVNPSITEARLENSLSQELIEKLDDSEFVPVLRLELVDSQSPDSH